MSNKQRIDELTTEIHRSLVELCSIADDEDLVLMTHIQTAYLNSGGIGVNAVLECDIKMVGEL